MRGEDMSILIKGMEMPETCDECKFHCYHSRGEYICVATPLFYPFNLANSKGIRKDWCPLVKVPVHGRLIDADKLMRDISEYHVSDGKFQHWVDVQPTVIEAERRTDD